MQEYSAPSIDIHTRWASLAVALILVSQLDWAIQIGSVGGRAGGPSDGVSRSRDFRESGATSALQPLELAELSLLPRDMSNADHDVKSCDMVTLACCDCPLPWHRWTFLQVIAGSCQE